MTLIGVKSKYGSCRGTCMGLIKVNNTQYIEIYTRKVPFVGMTGWAVNSIANSCRRFESFSSYYIALIAQR